MRLFVKRNKFRTFEEGKIEFNDSMEWTLLSSGLQKLLEDTIDSITFYEKYQNEQNEDCAEDIKNCLERKSHLEEMIKVLDHKNEQVWK